MFSCPGGPIGLLAGSLLGLATLTAVADPDDFQRQLDLASELNLTAPFQESQAILDRIEPQLDDATPDQYATFRLLQIRNLALAGSADQALDLNEQLLERSMPSKHRLRALALGANLGVLSRRFEESFQYLKKSLEFEPEVNEPELTTYVYSMAADIFRSIGDIERAIDYGHHAVNVAADHAQTRAECVARMRLSAAYRAGDYLPEALEHYRAALEQCRTADDPVYYAIVEFGLGDTLRRKGHLPEAESHLDQALERHRENDFRTGEAETKLALARVYLSTDRTETAREILSGLTDRFTELGRWDLLADSHQLLGEIASAAGNHALAFDHALEQIEARERFLDLERARQLAYREVEFETLIKEQELALLREQQRVSDLQQETQMQQRRLHVMAYASGGFLTLVLVLLLIHAVRERRHYQRLSRLDSLTGLSNHTRFFDLARLMVNEANSNETSLVLIMGDIDHFKQVNDVHGHHIGDEALRQVARVMKDSFANRGLVGRIGGEEFAVCMANETLQGVQAPLESLRRKLRSVDYGVDGRKLTMSFGLAQLLPAERLGSLRQRADLALYEAKKAGRDTVVVAPENSP